MMAQSRQRMRVTQARTTLLLDQPFFGVLALNLHIEEDPTCPTAWTNGTTLGYSPKFVDTLTDDQLVGLIAHEVMHCACGHPWRRGARDPQQWNIAADHAINHILSEARFTLPDGALMDAQYKGKSSEWIYDRLPPKSEGNGQGDGSGSGSFGEVCDAPGSDPNDPTQQPMSEADWQQATRSAVAAARGSLPASMKEQITIATSANVDWRSLLRRYAQEVIKSDYTWSRPNARYVASGIYLPSLRSVDAMGRLTIAVDTSGSIDTVLLGQFAAEIKAIADEIQPSHVEVVYCDSRIHRVDVFERGDDITIDAVGRGGTSFVPVFEHVERSGEVPAVMIYLTDLDGSFPASAPAYPVIWAAYGTRQTAPFGDTVLCE